MNRSIAALGRLLLALALALHGLPMQAAHASADGAANTTMPCHGDGGANTPSPDPDADCCDDCSFPCSSNVPAAAQTATEAVRSIAPDSELPGSCLARISVARAPPQRPPIA